MMDDSGSLLEWDKLTSARIAAFVRQIPQPVVVLQAGSLEQHGPHLPLGTDFLCAGARAEAVCCQTSSILLRTLVPGYSPQHRRFPGTITLRATTLQAVLEDVFDGIASTGFRKVLVVNGHAGNTAVLELAIAEARGRHPELKVAHPAGFPTEAAARYRDRLHRTLDVHAGAVETALVQWYFPELVDLDAPREVDHRPPAIARLQAGGDLDEVSRLLIETEVPADLARFTPDGIVGQGLVGGVPLDRVRQAHEETVAFLAEFVRRWQALDEDGG